MRQHRQFWVGFFWSLLSLGCVVALPDRTRGDTLHHSSRVLNSPEEQFKYGSVGAEKAEGIPYWIWRVLPSVCAAHLPGGYESLGVFREDGEDLPVGFSVQTVPISTDQICLSWLPSVDLPFGSVSAVGINCALCHTATYRTKAEEKPRLVLGGPAHQFNAQGYLKFLFECASGDAFTHDRIVAAIEKEAKVKMSMTEKILYRVLVPLTQCKIRQQKEQFGFMEKQVAWGPGRLDAVDAIKSKLLGIDPQGTVGITDMPAVWQLNPVHAHHWDGNNGDLEATIREEALATGATKRGLPKLDPALTALREFLQQLPPPSYPKEFPPVNEQLKAQGAVIFNAHCARCHGGTDGRATDVGKVLKLTEVNTDSHRLDSWTADASEETHKLTGEKASRKTDGYINVALNGIWLRAPYLHNGSVPTLHDLLSPAHARPPTFHRGYDVYDPEQLGFVHKGPEAEKVGVLYDTTQPGNSNQGHDGPGFGTDLSEEDKTALLEYLKTL
ncbi:MAG: c-type cytochrome [Deltaproteobacteria bacterium]|nr:c-type cytochrome [Deltaproteobacteria bacterium]